MDTFTRSLVDSGFARMVASALLDATQNCEAVTSHDLAESIGFLDSVDAEVEQSIKDRPVVKKTGIAREPERVREGLVLERTSLLSTLVGLGSFDDLVSDDNGNPVKFTSRIGLNGGFARVGDVPPKTEKKEGEKKGKNPDAWKKVPAAFVERMKRLLPGLTESGKTVNRDELVIAMKQDAGIDSDKFLREGLFDKWRLWASLTREGNPELQDESHRPLYVSTQGRTGGLKRAVYESAVSVPETAETSELSSEETEVSSETAESDEETAETGEEVSQGSSEEIVNV
jgi:hypothetical protein